MTMSLFNRRIAGAIVFALSAGNGMSQNGPGNGKAPQTPPNLQLPAGHVVYLEGHAVGTQNYMCAPGPSGPTWRFAGPQATLFYRVPWMQGNAAVQIMTHFLSPNPAESGTARPAWQSSHDSSAIWGQAVASSTDPNYVAPNSIPWLLVEIVGSKRGPTGGNGLSRTTYIQRLNTSGGVAPSDGCSESTYGAMALVPYTTDYFFARRLDGHNF